LRLQKELTELDIPSHAFVKFADDGSIMNFELTVNLKHEPCIWQGGVYQFSIEISPNYPHDAPKCHCLTPIYHPNIDL